MAIQKVLQALLHAHAGVFWVVWIHLYEASSWNSFFGERHSARLVYRGHVLAHH